MKQHSLPKKELVQGVSEITPLLSDPNAEVRMCAAEAFATLPIGTKVPKQLIDLLNDRNELVRVAAAESLGELRCRRSLPALRRALHDRSPLVRAYAAQALGQIGDKRNLDLIRQSLETERNEIARVGAFQGLYELGDRTAFDDLLLMLTNASDYRARCATANGLAALPLHHSDKLTATKFLRRALRSETTVAARSSIRSSLKTLTNQATA